MTPHRPGAEWVTVRILTPVTVTLALVAVGSVVVRITGGAVPMGAQIVPFAISVLVFGLPHGALDHLVPARLRPGVSVRASITVVVVLYLVVGSTTAGLWAMSPLLGFAVFIGITWFHWGQGDLFVDRLLDDGTAGRLGSVTTVATRGALPMLVPFIAQPAAALLVVTGMAASIGHDTADPGSVGGIPAVPRVIGAVIVVALVVLHVIAVRRAGSSPWRQCSEDIVLVTFFAVVPPVLAVGLYFTLWHSVRHVLRLELTDPVAAAELHRGRRLAPFARFMRQAWPITAIAVGMLVVLALVLRRADLSVYLALIAVLTTPHAIVVTWMDHVQGTWLSPRRARR